MRRCVAALLPAAVLSLAFLSCVKRTVVVEGVEMEYEAAAEKVYASARAAYDEGQCAKAVDGLRRFLADFEASAHADEARYFLARCLDRLGEHDQAMAAYRVLVERHPDSPYAPRARLELGLDHLAKGEYEAAAEVLRPAFDVLRGAGRLEAARALAQASLGLERWSEAVRWLAEVLGMAQAAGERAEAERALVELVDTRVPPVGLAKLREELDPGSPAYPLVLMKLAKLHFHLGDFGRAAQAARDYLAAGDDRYRSEATALLEKIDRLSRVEPRKVGIIVPTSGTYASFGKAVLDGVALALDLERGPAASGGIAVVVRDSAGDPETAVRAFEELVYDEHVIAVIGPLLSNTAIPVAAKAEELGVPLLAISRAEGLPQMGPWVFRNALTDRAQAEALVDFAETKLGARTYGIAYANHSFGVAMMNHFWDAVEARRHEVRAAERYDHDETTFGPIVKRLVGRYYLDYRPEYKRELERIKAEITDPYRRRKAIEKLQDEIPPVTDFDVLFIPDRYQTVSLIAPALAVEDVITNVCEERDLERIKKTTGKNRLGLVRLLGTNTWNHPDLVERGGKYVRCAIFVDGFFAGSARKATAEFVNAFQKVHGEGRTPGYLEATGYDSAAIVKAAITKHAPQTRAEMREALAHTDGFPGATGEIRFDAEGEVQKKLFFLTVDRKEGIVEVDVEHWPAPPGG